MGEVVDGPWGNEQLIRKFDNDLVDNLAGQMTDIVYDGMVEAGFDSMGEEQYVKDLGLINEAIRSYLLKLQERYHPVQDVAESLFEWSENNDYLIICDGMDIIFREDDL